MKYFLQQLTYSTYFRLFLTTIVFVLSTFVCSADNLTLYVGKPQYLAIPDTYEILAGSANWTCSHTQSQIDAYTTDKENGVTITITQYFSDIATISVTWTERGWNSRTGNYQFYARSNTWYVRCLPNYMQLYSTNIELNSGETYKLGYSFSPSTYGSAVVNWTSSNTNVAVAEAGTGNFATITAKGTGTAILTATSNVGPAVTCTVIVADPDPDMVSIQKTGKTKVGESFTLTPTLSPSGSKATYTWSSDNSSVATVSNSGVVTGKKTGTARITVKTHNGKTDYCDVTVEKGNLSLNCSNGSGLITKGSKVTLTANHSDAEIYYTLDGSTPTENSNPYTGSIAINEDLTLKAIAMGSEYNSSSIVTRTYQVTSLYRTDSWTGMEFYDSYFIPNVSYNNPVKIGNNFNQISLKNNNSETIPGQVIIQDGTVYYVPNGTLKEGLYKLTVPQGAIVDENDNPNLSVQLDFEKKDFVKFDKVSQGQSHTMIIDSDGTLWGCGSNYKGALGDGTTTDRTTPVKIMDGVATVAAGDSHSLIVMKDGTLWACGSNYDGELGDGTTTDRTTPVKIMDGVATVAADFYYSLIVKKDGTLWACGYNYYGQFGDGTTTDRTTPVKIMDGVATVAAGIYHSLIVKKDGTLWACGGNQGRLGDGTTTDRTTPVKIMDGVATVAAGTWQSLIVKKDGTLWACGDNGHGELGDGTTTMRTKPVKIMDDVATVAAGGNHSLFVKKDGTLWACGLNKYGQLGDGTTTKRTTPVKIMDGVATVAAGRSHSLIVKKDGTLWMCGSYKYGLTDDPSAMIVNPIQIRKSFFSDISEVTIKDSVIEMSIGDKYLVIPQLSPSNACSKSMVFSSSNTDVATVSSHGIVEAINSGRANISLLVDGTYEAVLELTVADKHDVDKNGIVDIADMVLTINHVMGKEQQGVTLKKRMDMNGDGQVDVGDVILIIKAILAQGGQVEVPAEARGKAGMFDLTQYTAMQLNVTVPMGTEIAEIQIAGHNSDTHQLMYLKSGDDSYTVVIYSLDNQTFSHVEGSLLKVTLDGDGEPVMSNVLLCTPTGERIFVGSMPMGTATGISTVGTTHTNSNAIYDLRGNKVQPKGKLPKGVYIMNGKKVIK